MIRRKMLGLAASLLAAAGFSGTQAEAAPAPLATLSVTNSLATARPDEVIDLPLADVLAHARGVKPANLIVHDAGSGKLLVTQLIDEGSGSPDHLLIQTDIGPRQTRRLQISTAATPPKFPARVYGRFAPERKDDFGWENDKIAFRIYGPKLQSLGEIGSGIDVWCKRVPSLVINEWYHREAEAAKVGKEAVHTDVGTGLDCYKVGYGIFRGCGGTGFWDNGKLDVSQNYTTWKVLANGPIRTTFEVTYAPWDVAGTQVSEVKRISLDAGSHMNHLHSTFHFNGPDTLTAAAGIEEHADYTVYSAPDQGIASIWEPASDLGASKKPQGMIPTGLVALPGAHPEYKEALGHVLFLYPVKSDQAIDYYAGAGWSERDMPTQAAWNAYLTDFAARLKSPLRVQWTK